MSELDLSLALAVRVGACGLFISSGKGTHPDRVLDSYELIVVRKGTLAIWENDVRFDVPPGHTLLLHPGRRHRGAEPFPRDLSFYWIHFTLEPSEARTASLRVPQFAKAERPACLAQIFHRYLDDQEAGRIEPLYASLTLLMLLSEVARVPAARELPRRTVLTGRAEAYVTRHLAEKLSTARIARALRINPDYLNRSFREVHKVTMTEYIHRRKLMDAAGMLRDTTDAVTEIASACGFMSVGHFRRVFERYHGVSPRAYRSLMARAYVNAR